MNWKLPLALFGGFLLIVILVTLLQPSDPNTFQTQNISVISNKSFSISFRGSGLVDNDLGKTVRAYVGFDSVSQGNLNTTLELISLSKPPRSGVYYISDYQISAGKHAILSTVTDNLGKYGVPVSPITLDNAMKKENSIIILPTDAIPDTIANDKLPQLIDSNVVIFFGKPLNLAIDASCSQIQMGDKIFSTLQVTQDHDGDMTPRADGPKRLDVCNSTVLEYSSGWFVVYPDSDNSSLGTEIADIIKTEGWQSQRMETDFTLTNKTSSLLFSKPIQSGDYYLRVLFDSKAANFSNSGLRDLGFFRKTNGTLRMSDLASSSGRFDYTYELSDNLTYPTTYNLNLQFIKDNSITDRKDIQVITMKTYATESGSVSPNLTAGDYLVKLVDQNNEVQAAAYTHVPSVRVRLIRIEDTVHVFNLTMDGKPVVGQMIDLIADGQKTYELQTDGSGLARVAFSLETGRHSFMVDFKGWKDTTYYIKTEEQANLMLYGVFIFGALFLGFVVYFGTRTQKKFGIRVHHRSPVASKTLRVSYSTFNDLFKMTQADRAPGLPLLVSDLRIGIRKHSTFKGAPLFVTDSNIYKILDQLTKKGAMLSYRGFFMPLEAAGGLPAEYWAMKRRIMDCLMENGEKTNGELVVRGKRLHLWPKLNPTLIAGKPDNILIFPDEERKAKYLSSSQKHNPLLTQLSLEIQYGQIKCMTIDEWIGRFNR